MESDRRGRELVARLKEVIPKDKSRGFARLFGAGALLLIVTVAVSGYIRPFWYPIEHRENVYVFNETRGMDQSWGIWTRQYGWERFDCCPDLPCNRGVVKVGFIADELKYQERGYCKSIRDEGLGWWWHQNGRTRRIPYE